MFDDLDPLLHSQLRLAVVSLLVGVEQAEFVYLQEQTQSTAGNLSIQIKKLVEAGYVEVEKTYRNNYPLTLCRITPTGLAAFERYVKALEQYIRKG